MGGLHCAKRLDIQRRKASLILKYYFMRQLKTLANPKWLSSIRAIALSHLVVRLVTVVSSTLREPCTAGLY